MSLKQLTKSKAAKFGTFLMEFATPGIGHILKAAGCDFVLVDMEHSGIGLEAIKSLLRYLEAAELPAIIGLPTREPFHISRVLDVGAEGVMSPMVTSAKDVREAVRLAKFPPQGERAVSIQVGHDRYAPSPVREMLANTNERTVYFAKIENAAAVEDIEQIVAVEHLDGLWLGHYDLSASLGIAGQFDNTTFKKAVSRVVATCLARNLSLGRIVSSVEEGQSLYEEGFDFLSYSGDAWILRDSLATAVRSMRENCAAK
jgi:2-dehydro-3-deoxyglucarate aldolase/4-hydroxy-2-oxoheptanedioate aldolase